MAQNQSSDSQSLAEITETQRQLNLELDKSGKLSQQFGKEMTAAFIAVAAQGKSLGDVVQSLGQKLSGLALNAAFKPLENAFSSALGGIVQSAVGLPDPFAASGVLAAPPGLSAATEQAFSGASVQAAGAPMTGFGGSGMGGSGASPSIVLNVTTPDAESFRRSETQLAAVLARAAAHGQRNL